MKKKYKRFLEGVFFILSLSPDGRNIETKIGREETKAGFAQ